MQDVEPSLSKQSWQRESDPAITQNVAMLSHKLLLWSSHLSSFIWKRIPTVATWAFPIGYHNNSRHWTSTQASSPWLWCWGIPELFQSRKNYSSEVLDGSFACFLSWHLQILLIWLFSAEKRLKSLRSRRISHQDGFFLVAKIIAKENVKWRQLSSFWGVKRVQRKINLLFQAKKFCSTSRCVWMLQLLTWQWLWCAEVPQIILEFFHCLEP